MGITQEYSKQSFVTAVEAALALGDLDKAKELLAVVEAIPAGSSPQFLQAQSSRFRARVAARQGDADEAERRFKRAAGLFRELALLFYLGVTQLEHGEWLAQQVRATEAEPLLAESREIFERLGAKPWLERMEAGGAPRPAQARATLLLPFHMFPPHSFRYNL
jgi:tetratricopeptide (TPR) repeat protein